MLPSMTDDDAAQRIAQLVLQHMQPQLQQVTTIANDVQQLSVKFDSVQASFSGVPAVVAQQSRKICSLERDLAAMQYQLRGLQHTREMNIALFPAPGKLDGFKQARFDHFALPLGLSDMKQLSKVYRSDGVLIVRCPTVEFKRQVMARDNMDKAKNAHGVIMREDLLLEERAEQIQLRPVMQHLHSQEIRASWKRSAITWKGKSGKRCYILPWELQFHSIDELLRLTDERHNMMDLEGELDAAPASQPAYTGLQAHTQAGVQHQQVQHQQPEPAHTGPQAHAQAGAQQQQAGRSVQHTQQPQTLPRQQGSAQQRQPAQGSTQQSPRSAQLTQPAQQSQPAQQHQPAQQPATNNHVPGDNPFATSAVQTRSQAQGRKSMPASNLQSHGVHKRQGTVHSNKTHRSKQLEAMSSLDVNPFAPLSSLATEGALN
jgi:hypothetical protein